MRKKSVLISVFTISDLATCLTGCGSKVETESSVANQVQVAEVQAAETDVLEAAPVADVQSATEAEDVKYVYDKQVDLMNDASWELFYSEENQEYLKALKGNVIIFNIDGNYVVTKEQFEQLKVMADEANWCGCLECAILFGNKIDDA